MATRGDAQHAPHGSDASQDFQGKRRILPLNRGWRYGGPVAILRGDYWAAGYDDSGFERVTIPHANQRVPWHSLDDRDYQFVSIYRRHFTLPADLRGRRVFVDFDGVMTASRVWLNGTLLGEYRGGYTPFSFELTDHLRWGGSGGSSGEEDGQNVLAVEVDSTERADIPPVGGRIDYLTFGGIYRDVRLRAVPHTFIANVFVKPVDVLTDARRLDVRVFLDGATEATAHGLRVVAEVQDGGTVILSAAKDLSRSAEQLASAAQAGTPGAAMDLTAPLPDSIQLWDLDTPTLYGVEVRLLRGNEVLDVYRTRIGFRDARFTQQGFHLNGRHVKLRGLNRHQTYPWVGQAMPARVQRRDAEIVKRELKCNVVRTSHYPQSPAFLDACDEIGLLVFEEIPGWQHIGDPGWKDIACRNVAEMIQRDWNHPSIILWGVRINESKDDHDFYVRTNQIAHSLDDSRQSGGVRFNYQSERLEDVFTMNDFQPDELREPNHTLYLNTEFVGHMYPTKHIDNVERVQEHVRRHAHIHHLLGEDPQYAGGIGWCAFDYNTHADFGSGDRICYHGVSDIFRIAKPAAGFYKSQCDPAEEIVLEPAFHWAIGDRSGGGGPGGGPLHGALICSNCDHLKLYVGDRLTAEADPDREHFGNLPHPPFLISNLRGTWGQAWEDLRIEGYLDGKLVVTRTMSGRGVDRQFHLAVDDVELLADASDATRVVFRVTDEFGNTRPFATGAVHLQVEGPAQIIGENPFALTGGVGAVWLRTTEQAGTMRLTATHPVLGPQTVELRSVPVPPEPC